MVDELGMCDHFNHDEWFAEIDVPKSPGWVTRHCARCGYSSDWHSPERVAELLLRIAELESEVTRLRARS